MDTIKAMEFWYFLSAISSRLGIHGRVLTPWNNVQLWLGLRLEFVQVPGAWYRYRFSLAFPQCTSCTYVTVSTASNSCSLSLPSMWASTLSLSFIHVCASSFVVVCRQMRRVAVQSLCESFWRSIILLRLPSVAMTLSCWPSRHCWRWSSLAVRVWSWQSWREGSSWR